MTSPSAIALFGFCLICWCGTLTNGQNATFCPATQAKDVKSTTLRFNEFEIPSGEASFICQSFQVPADQEYHIIAYEPVISNSNAMHDMILYICDTPTMEAKIQKSKNFTKPTQCDIEPDECSNAYIVWAAGQQGRCLPSEAGLLMGNNSYRNVILQIGYNNPQKKGGIKDSSGIKLYYTAKKRANDMAQVRSAQYDISVPPGSQSTKIIGRAFESTDCSKELLSGSSSYNITRVQFRLGQAATRVKLIVENGDKTKLTIFDDAFSYGRPNEIVWQAPNYPSFQPGDNFVIECTFATPNRTKWTSYGKNAGDEMCQASLEVYPRPSNLNFVEIGSLGLVDSCTRVDMRSVAAHCDMNVLNDVIASIKNDSSWSLSGACGGTLTSNSTDCCRFLSKHDFLSYECVYSSASQLVRSLNLTKSQDPNIIHSNILRCINAVQSITLEQLNRGIAVFLPNSLLLLLATVLVTFATLQW